MAAPHLSVIVVYYDIPEQISRTLTSLSPAVQQNVQGKDYEVVLVDNGSSMPVPKPVVKQFRQEGGRLRLIRVRHPGPSPAAAINLGVRKAEAAHVALMIDGARLVTPGFVAEMIAALRTHPSAIVATLGWYLGCDLQGLAAEQWYDRETEQGLLERIEWPADGYRLFDIATPDESSAGARHRPIQESNGLGLSKKLFKTLGGMEERFERPGGGLVNLDFFKRAVEFPQTRLVLLTREASFHQLHGGVSTNAPHAAQETNWQSAQAEYQKIRGRPFQPPAIRPSLFGPLDPHIEACLEARPPPGPFPDAVAEVQAAHAALCRGEATLAAELCRLVLRSDPGDRDAFAVLARVSGATPIEHLRGRERAGIEAALGRVLAARGDVAGAEARFAVALREDADCTAARLAWAQLRYPGPDYLAWLDWFHDRLNPAFYLEIGVFEGDSLARAGPATLAFGIDPAARLRQPVQAPTQLFPMLSDTFFALLDPRSLTNGRGLDLAFVDGLHSFAQCYTDIANLEPSMAPGGVILVHDTLPFDAASATRDQRTGFYTGEVWRVVPAIRAVRPDLTVFTIPCAPSGLSVVTGFSERSTTLLDASDEILQRFDEVPSWGDLEQDRAGLLALCDNDPEIVADQLRPRRKS